MLSLEISETKTDFNSNILLSIIWKQSLKGVDIKVDEFFFFVFLSF
jgi:hypothetical protein